jgi:hypothetical protein
MQPWQILAILCRSLGVLVPKDFNYLLAFKSLALSVPDEGCSERT